MTLRALHEIAKPLRRANIGVLEHTEKKRDVQHQHRCFAAHAEQYRQCETAYEREARHVERTEPERAERVEPLRAVMHLVEAAPEPVIAVHRAVPKIKKKLIGKNSAYSLQPDARTIVPPGWQARHGAKPLPEIFTVTAALPHPEQIPRREQEECRNEKEAVKPKHLGPGRNGEPTAFKQLSTESTEHTEKIIDQSAEAGRRNIRLRQEAMKPGRMRPSAREWIRGFAPNESEWTSFDFCTHPLALIATEFMASWVPANLVSSGVQYGRRETARAR